MQLIKLMTYTDQRNRGSVEEACEACMALYEEVKHQDNLEKIERKESGSTTISDKHTLMRRVVVSPEKRIEDMCLQDKLLKYSTNPSSEWKTKNKFKGN